ncbi:MAG TPA: signal peptidase I [Solirubrobacteraceae bacterium]|nr:signal peptidase I [Solirubrobacteraceae bacterium]
MRRGTAVLLGVFGLVGALIVAGFVTRAVAMDAQSYRAASESMLPTIELGERVTLNRGAYDDAAPEVGDIVIHHPPMGAEAGECGAQPGVGQMCARPTPERSDVTFIKRVVAGPGDRVALREGRVVRDGEPQREPYIGPCDGGEGCDFPRPVTIPDGHYFLLGDNRGASDDSRFWGPVPREWIEGRAEDCDIIRISCSPVR